eukprot:8683714-Karenia_brevis.AAC.2
MSICPRQAQWSVGVAPHVAGFPPLRASDVRNLVQAIRTDSILFLTITLLLDVNLLELSIPELPWVTSLIRFCRAKGAAKLASSCDARRRKPRN